MFKNFNRIEFANFNILIFFVIVYYICAYIFMYGNMLMKKIIE